MYCYLIRHGQDDESIRGGWSAHPLTEKGRRQAEELAEKNMDIVNIYSSDLPRAMETAEIMARAKNLPVVPLASFREVNNGKLAGMKHHLAEQLYPGVYWNTLRWEEHFPEGESPEEFYQRVSAAWDRFSKEMTEQNGNVALVTHGGVIQVILSIVQGLPYSNKQSIRKVKNAEIVVLELKNGVWTEKEITH